MRLCRGVFAFAVIAGAVQARAQATCPSGALPAYAHNDYANERPLLDALELGFRGAEADVHLIGGILRVGHDRREAAHAPSLEAVYLAPLRALSARCGGRVLASHAPFLLTLELKERSPVAFDSLAALLARYGDLLAAPATGRRIAPVEVVLVGWHPGPAHLESHPVLPLAVGVQRLVDPSAGATAARDTARLRLLSVNYGKRVARRWRRDPAPTTWLALLAGQRQAAPMARARVFNVPESRSLYRALLDGGVDLIGTERPAAAARLLRELAWDEAGAGVRPAR